MSTTKGGCCRNGSDKAVRFHPTPSYIPLQQSNEYQPPPLSSSLWYTHDEYSFLRTKSKLLGLEIRRSNAGKLNCVNIAYHVAGQLASSLEKTEAEEEMAMSHVPLDETLLDWCSCSTNAGRHTRRGLERVGSKSHNADRGIDQRSAIRNVLAEQDRQRSQQRHASLKKWRLQQQQQRQKQRRQEESCGFTNLDGCNDDFHFSGDDIDEKDEDEETEEMNKQKLRMASMSSTRRARLFARMLGEADAAEAIRILQVPNEVDTLEEYNTSSSPDAVWSKILRTTAKFKNNGDERGTNETFSVENSKKFPSTATLSFPSPALSAPQ